MSFVCVVNLPLICEFSVEPVTLICRLYVNDLPWKKDFGIKGRQCVRKTAYARNIFWLCLFFYNSFTYKFIIGSNLQGKIHAWRVPNQLMKLFWFIWWCDGKAIVGHSQTKPVRMLLSKSNLTWFDLIFVFHLTCLADGRQSIPNHASFAAMISFTNKM